MTPSEQSFTDCKSECNEPLTVGQTPDLKGVKRLIENTDGQHMAANL